MTDHLRFADSVVIARSPEDVYDLVSDVTRTGEWSPTCVACWWDEGDGADAAAQVDERRRSAHDGIPRSLAAVKAIAERA